MFSWRVVFTVQEGSMLLFDMNYYCKAWTKRGAWKKAIKATDNWHHYASKEYRHSFKRMKHDIYRVGKEVIDGNYL